MKLIKIIILIIISVLYLPCLNGGRVLFVTPMGTKSHKFFIMGIAEALAKKGHQATVISPFEPTKPIENIREVLIHNYSVDTYLEKAFEEKSLVIMKFFIVAVDACIDGLKQQQIQALKEEKFDAVIVNIFFSQCYLSLVHHFKVPLIFVSPQGIVGPSHQMVGNIDFPAISGNAMSEPSIPITFSRRLKSTAVNTIYTLLNTFYLEPQMYSKCVKNGLCPEDMPPFHEICENVSLTIINCVRTLDNPPRPSMPNVIYAGGAHIKPPKKLPVELEKWIEGSGEEGFIFFSIGSAMNPDFLPEEYRQILVKVFGSLKQRVLWKWNKETMPDLPSNVKLQKWLPQTDLLGHPKIKLFITHGGLLSTLESSYHGVPIIGMPIFSDQFSNMALVETEGCGRVMEWTKLKENTFRDLIQEVLNNETLINTAKHKSVIMKDRLVPPDEEAAYWVEYVMRHKGAPHIKSPLGSMSWYEVYNMDVWAFILSIIAGVLYISWLLLKFIFRKCFGIGISKKTKRKND
ncbi:UNVERIFIED_CONTAM: hypothetical protein RMT77_018770 [Armadillidium vulgare]